MIKKLINGIFKPRHPWRTIDFDELSELYVSMLFRNLALSLVGIFVPIYLYQLGYSLVSILSFFGVFFTFRIMWDFVGGFIVARLGPKHGMAISYILQVVALAMFTTMPYITWPIWIIAILWGGANSIFFIAYHVDFSKIKHSIHGGKELGNMNIMERIGAMLGPLVGGILATTAGPQYAFMAATVFFIFGTIPLFLSAEPVKVKQHLDFKGLHADTIKRDLLSYAALTVEHSIGLVLWPLFISLFVITGAIYVKIGGLASLSAVIAVLTAYSIGKLIDNNRGALLLKYSAYANTAVHLARPFISTLTGATVLTAAQETLQTSMRMAYTKPMYDAADTHQGHRIVYIVGMESTGSLAKATVYWFLCIMATMLTAFTVLTVAFVIAAGASMLILVERFPAFRSNRIINK